MKLTYIFHSSFALETDQCLIIFDYWLDPSEIIPQLLTSPKPLYVLSSHFHEDHFNREIFKWREYHTDITYILSKDILRHRRAQKEEADVWMGKGANWHDDNITITATGSNDSGVSWVIETEGKYIFHAGDLNSWYARFLSEPAAIPTTVINEDNKEINPIQEEKRFLGELKDILKISNHFNLVMFPIDSRVGNGYTLGARQFIDRFKVGMFVPMHFTAGGYESSWRMYEYCTEKDIAFWQIHTEGESIIL